MVEPGIGSVCGLGLEWKPP